MLGHDQIPVFWILFSLFFFLMWTVFKVFIEFVTILLASRFGFWPRGMWDLSSPTRDGTLTPCIGRRSLNHWTTREVPIFPMFCFQQRTSVTDLEINTLNFNTRVNTLNYNTRMNKIHWPSWPQHFLFPEGSSIHFLLMACSDPVLNSCPFQYQLLFS